MGQPQSEKQIYAMIGQASTSERPVITLDEFKRSIGEQKRLASLIDAEETLDAFVSMGGEQDGTGHVNAQRLIEIVRQEFQMTIDIQKLIREIDTDNSGKIEYDEFMTLLCAPSQEQS